MKKKLVFSLRCLYLLILLLAACGTDDNREFWFINSKKADTFTVGLEAGYAPFNWTQMDDSNGGVKIDGNAEYAGGYDVEIAKKIAEGLGKELVIVKTEWDGLSASITIR